MTASTLKLIALSAMILDHLAVAFPETIPVEVRIIGRLSWPIFAYLLAEGFKHTRSRRNMLLRLAAFALISEIPYDIVAGNPLDFLANTNIFYTLFLGGLAIHLFERFDLITGKTLAAVCGIFPAAFLGEILGVEYGGLGVLFIFAMYFIPHKTVRLIFMGIFVLLQFLPLMLGVPMGEHGTIFYVMAMLFSLIPILLIAQYNNQRGYRLKWLFYTAYPLHLAIFGVVMHL